MAVEATGTPIEIQSAVNAGSQSITVPADATAIEVCVTGYSSGVLLFSGGSMTLGGVPLNENIADAEEFFRVGQFWLVNPATGSQTLAWDWAGTAAPEMGVIIVVTFRKGVDTADPIRDSFADQFASEPFSTDVLTAQAGDLVSAWAGMFGGAPPTVTWTNATKIDDYGNFQFGVASLAEGSPSGNVQVTADFDTTSDGGIVALVWKAAGASTTREQEGARFRNDDGSESAATWLAAQDANITRQVSLNTRLRLLLNATGDPASAQYRLDYKKSTDASYEAVPTAQPTIVRTSMTSGQSTSNVATFDTASITLTAGRLYTIGIVHSDTAPETVPSSVQTVGGAVSFTLVDSQVFDTLASPVHVLSLWRALPASGVTAAIRITLPDAGTGCSWVVEEWQNIDPSGTNGSGALGTPVKNGVNAATSIATTPAALASTRSYQYAVAGLDLNSTADTASGTSWSSVNGGQTYATPNTAIEHAANTSGTASQVTFSGAGSADRAVIAVEIKARSRPILVSASSNIAASGESTTAQLTPPTGKTTSDFVAGRIMDDENPSDAIDLTADDYTEVEWCLSAVSGVAQDGDIYQFRVSVGGTPLDTYSVTPEWTIGTPTTKSLLYGRPSIANLLLR